MTKVAQHKGVTIYEDYGYYTSSLDPTVESRNLEDIVEFIDDVLNGSKRSEEGFIVDIFIVTEGAVIVHKAKERMYTREDMEASYSEGRKFEHDLEQGVEYTMEDNHFNNHFKEWFNKHYPQ